MATFADGPEDAVKSKRPQFGTRFLKDSESVFHHNAWDDVEWSSEQEEDAAMKVSVHSQNRMDKARQKQIDLETPQSWEKFYVQHKTSFFKDRNWLFTEFPELAVSPKDGDVNIFEVGCGVGNSIFPILKANKSPNIKLYCCDLSSTAIQLIKNHPNFEPARCIPFVWDVTSDASMPVPELSMDIIVLIFVLSAVHTSKFGSTISRLSKYLKPGGCFLFRDYGRYDMAQLRFKAERCLSDNFYARGDGTRVYFFTQDEVGNLFRGAGLSEKQNVIDRRLQVNRNKMVKMYRVWIQCKYYKPIL